MPTPAREVQAHRAIELGPKCPSSEGEPLPKRPSSGRAPPGDDPGYILSREFWQIARDRDQQVQGPVVRQLVDEARAKFDKLGQMKGGSCMALCRRSTKLIGPVGRHEQQHNKDLSLLDDSRSLLVNQLVVATKGGS